MLLSAYMNGEKITTFNAVFTVVSLGGVIMIFAGFDSENTFIGETEEPDSSTSVIVLFGAALVPLINGWGNILTRRLKTRRCSDLVTSTNSSS